MRHKALGYVGIVCGRDRACYETKPWLEKALGPGGAEALPSGRGADQPFYLVLPDVRAVSMVATVYLAEDLLEAAPKARARACGGERSVWGSAAPPPRRNSAFPCSGAWAAAVDGSGE